MWALYASAKKHPTDLRNLELDIKKIAKLGEQNEEENYGFRIFLKEQDLKKVDRITSQLNEAVTSQIDCQECGNCCKTLRPSLTESEIDRLSQIDKISRPEYLSKFVENNEGIRYLKDMPCKYHKGNICSIYSNRPEDCKSYPHTHKTDFISRTIEMIDNYGICPIVFNLFESLKDELNFKHHKPLL